MSKAVLSAILILAACSGKKDEERRLPDEPPSVAPTPAPANPTAPPPAAPQPPTLGKLGCGAVVGGLAPAILTGRAVAALDGGTETSVRCSVGAAGAADRAEVVADCPPAMAGTPEAAVQAFKDQHKDASDLAGVGKVAVTRKAAANQIVVVAWDDDSACRVDVTSAKADDASAIAKAVLAAVPPKPPAEATPPAAGSSAPAPAATPTPGATPASPSTPAAPSGSAAKT